MDPVVGAATIGTIDAGLFLAKRPKLLVQSPGRALGGLAFLGLWIALSANVRRDGALPSKKTVTLAGIVTTGNAAMLAIHLKNNVNQSRIFVGTAAGAVALTGSLLRR